MTSDEEYAAAFKKAAPAEVIGTPKVQLEESALLPRATHSYSKNTYGGSVTVLPGPDQGAAPAVMPGAQVPGGVLASA